MDIKEILARCDHTLLRQTSTGEEILSLCDEGIKYGVASVCIPPHYVKMAGDHISSRIKICTVIGFPNGYSTTAVKIYETEDAIKNGADEIDMVINLAMVKNSAYEDVLGEISQIRNICKNKILKVIIETCCLSTEEKIRLCGIVSDSGADYIKTSTGFGGNGATREDVALLREKCAPHVKVKASGGIQTLQDAEGFIKLGADRLGTSRIVNLAMDLGRNSTGKP